MGGFGMETNLMRNAIAILLFVNALEFIEQRRALPYFSICFLALTFHLSSVFYFPLYFFFHKPCKKWIFITIFIIGNFILLAHIKLFTPILGAITGTGGKAENVMNAYSDTYGDLGFKISIGYLERLLTGILIICYYDKLIKVRKENIIFVNAFLAYISMTFFLSEMTVVSERMSGLFIFAYWILWPDLLMCMNIKNNRKLFMSFVFIYCIMKMIGMTKEKILEYDNLLFGGKSYNERLYIFNKNFEEPDQ